MMMLSLPSRPSFVKYINKRSRKVLLSLKQRTLLMSNKDRKVRAISLAYNQLLTHPTNARDNT